VPQFQVRELAALRVGGEGGPSRPKTPRPLVLRALLFTQKVPSARDGWDSRQALLSQFKGTFHANRRPQVIPGESPRLAYPEHLLATSLTRRGRMSVWALGSRKRSSRFFQADARCRSLLAQLPGNPSDLDVPRKAHGLQLNVFVDALGTTLPADAAAFEAPHRRMESDDVAV